MTQYLTYTPEPVSPATAIGAAFRAWLPFAVAVLALTVLMLTVMGSSSYDPDDAPAAAGLIIGLAWILRSTWSRMASAERPR